MNHTYLIADTHFGHRKIIEFEADNRPFATIEEHDAELVDRWNSTVNKQDTVWHLGDVLFGSHCFELLGKLNGQKHLVMGNHDHYPTARYLEHFKRLHGAAELKGYILTHVPVDDGQFWRYKGNFHGHLHSKSISDSMSHFCVSAEHHFLMPIRLMAAIELIEEAKSTGNKHRG